jgi:HEAT repeat protein
MFLKTRLLQLALILFVSALPVWVHCQSPIDGVDARTNTADLAKQLASSDPLMRQRSAEALAQLAATDQRKIVEGYALEEKNKDVRLALEWALYRMGKSESLFRVVRDLDSGRQDQAIGYLYALESPEFLYSFLKNQNNPPKVTAGLLKVLARIGNAETLELIKPYRESLKPFVAEAAETASDEIEKRLGQEASTPTSGRPRTTGKPQPQ